MRITKKEIPTYKQVKVGTKTKNVYLSEDGKEFDLKSDCIKYEKNLDLEKSVKNILKVVELDSDSKIIFYNKLISFKLGNCDDGIKVTKIFLLVPQDDNVKIIAEYLRTNFRYYYITKIDFKIGEPAILAFYETNPNSENSDYSSSIFYINEIIADLEYFSLESKKLISLLATK